MTRTVNARHRHEDDPQTLMRRAAGDECERHQHRPGQDKLRPCSARERQKERGEQNGQHQRAAHHVAAGHRALEQKKHGQYQEGAKHVGIVEGAARPSVQDEHIRDAAEQVEITDEGGKRSNERGCKIPAQQKREPPLRVGADHRGIENGCGGKECGYEHPGHRLALIAHRDHCDGVSDVHEHEQQEKRRQGRAHRHPQQQEKEAGDSGDDLVGARLDEDECAGKAGQPEEGAAQGFGTEAGGSRNGLHRAHGCVSRMRRNASAYTADALATLGASDAVKLAQTA